MDYTPKYTKQEAEKICGTLTKTSKMPGASLNLPASKCITGTKLHGQKNTICSKCYALKGRYRFNNVQNAMDKRFDGLRHPDWKDAVISLIGREAAKNTLGSPYYFRFFDSGDLQSVDHLLDIFEVARALPNVKFWIPTRERVLLRDAARRLGKDYTIPPNVCIRLSATAIDETIHGETIGGTTYPTSSVTTLGNYTCPAPHQGNTCGECRACWDKNVTNVAYKAH